MGKYLEDCANYIIGFSIDEVWRDAINICITNGYDYVVQKGSYEGQIRRQLPYAQIIIKNPSTRPLSPILAPGIPPPTSDEKIEKYFTTYLMSDELQENEVYTYGQYISKQLPQVINLLNASKGNTNQACITIGDTNSIFLDDPPCLRSISFKVVNKKLMMTVYFRSWDLYAAMPENLGGLQLLKEYVISNLEFECYDGSIIAFSDGIHIYEQYFDIVNKLSVNKIIL